MDSVEVMRRTNGRVSAGGMVIRNDITQHSDNGENPHRVELVL